MKRSALTVFAFVLVMASACAQKFTADDLNRRTIERRAIAAMNWGMPAVNYDRMVQAMLGANGVGARRSGWRGSARGTSAA